MLNRVERDFLSAGEAAERRRRASRRKRVRRSFAALVAALAAITAVAVVALNQAAAAHRERDIARSRELAAEAETTLTSDPGLSLVLARRAIDTRSTVQAADALRQAVLDFRGLAVLHFPGRPVNGVDLAGDGQRVVGASADGRLVIWRLRDRALLTRVPVHRGEA